MHDYQTLRKEHGNLVSQTVDSPIMVLDYLELSDAFMAVGIVLVFGVIFYSWKLMFFMLAMCLGVVPVVKKRFERGIFLHAPYRYLGMSLPGLINPGVRQKYSD